MNTTDRSTAAESELLALCREDFQAAMNAFVDTLQQQFHLICDCAQNIMRDLMQQVLGKSGILGGIRFDAQDDTFDEQRALSLLPSIFTIPIETLLNICVSDLNEKNKEKLLSLLIDTCNMKIESFITTTTFRFAGALKFEECVRSYISMTGKISNLPIRSKFSRLREVMMVLTSDVRSASFADTLSQLTATEAQSILALRLDNAF